MIQHAQIMTYEYFKLPYSRIFARVVILKRLKLAPFVDYFSKRGVRSLTIGDRVSHYLLPSFILKAAQPQPLDWFWWQSLQRCVWECMCQFFSVLLIKKLSEMGIVMWLLASWFSILRWSPRKGLTARFLRNEWNRFWRNWNCCPNESLIFLRFQKRILVYTFWSKIQVLYKL